MDERDLDNFFAARGVKPECPICTESQWGFVGDDDGTEMRFVGKSQDGSLAQGIGVSLLICRHCGFVSAHAHSVISGRVE